MHDAILKRMIPDYVCTVHFSANSNDAMSAACRSLVPLLALQYCSTSSVPSGYAQHNIGD